MARARALGFAPDLILVQLCLNDPHSSDVDALWSGPQPFFRLSSTLLRLFHYERHVAYFAVDRFYDTKGLAQLDRAFAGFSEIARAGTPVAAVLFPYLHRAAYHDWGFAEYHRRFDEAARRHQVPLLDLRETFERAGLIRDIGPADAVHPDAAGHTLAATEVTAWLETQGFMER
jgi:lysophospholipase L1-like esterase